MITQDFLREFEVALLKSYNRATKASASKFGASPLQAARSQEQFMNAFMAALREQQDALSREVSRGGHREPLKLVNEVHRLVEQKVRLNAFHGQTDTKAFQKTVRELKNEVRSVFYGPG